MEVERTDSQVIQRARTWFKLGRDEAIAAFRLYATSLGKEVPEGNAFITCPDSSDARDDGSYSLVIEHRDPAPAE